MLRLTAAVLLHCLLAARALAHVSTGVRTAQRPRLLLAGAARRRRSRAPLRRLARMRGLLRTARSVCICVRGRRCRSRRTRPCMRHVALPRGEQAHIHACRRAHRGARLFPRWHAWHTCMLFWRGGRLLCMRSLCLRLIEGAREEGRRLACRRGSRLARHCHACIAWPCRAGMAAAHRRTGWAEQVGRHDAGGGCRRRTAFEERLRHPRVSGWRRGRKVPGRDVPRKIARGCSVKEEAGHLVCSRRACAPASRSGHSLRSRQCETGQRGA
jgi:hypothetical protein